MKKDIHSRTDIERLVNAFYEKIKVDNTVGYFFTEVVMVNWDQHLPRMYDFWENIVFSTGHHQGNPMTVHHSIHAKSPLSKKHFNRWLKLFIETVDENFAGKNAELIKERATGIAKVMQGSIALG
jgi:hemoglobin